jgi:hypothetical protein
MPLFSFLSRKRPVSTGIETHTKKRRKHFIVPWLESPLQGADEEERVFSQRHEANTLELFFE